MQFVVLSGGGRVGGDICPWHRDLGCQITATGNIINDKMYIAVHKMG